MRFIRHLTMAAAAALAFASPAHAITVTETGANLTKNSETAANTSAMKITLGNIEQLLTLIFKAIGPEGTFSQSENLGSMLSVGVDNFNLDDVLGSSSGVSRIFPDLGSLKEAGNLIGAGTVGDQVADVEQGIRMVRQVFSNLESLKSLDPRDAETALRKLDELRRRYAFDMAEESMGVALFAREAVAKGPSRISKLSIQARGSTNLRQQMAVQQATIMSLIEEVQRTQGLIATQVQAQSADKLAGKTDGSTGLFSSPIQTPAADPEGGGDVFQ